MASTDDYLIDTLLDLGVLTHEQVDEVRDTADSRGEGVVDTLLEQNTISPADVTHAKAAHFGAEVIDLNDFRLTDDVIAAVPRHVAKRYKIVPVDAHDGAVTVAISDPSDLDTIDSLTHVLNKQVEVRVAPEEDIDEAISRYYGEQDDTVGKMIQDITEGEVELEGPAGGGGGLTDDGTAVDADAPIIKLVNSLIVEAFKIRASDIHLEPLEKKFRIRYRIDGVLHEMKSPPKRLQASVISRLKIQANMAIAEKRVPQDGRIQTTIGGKKIDLRVSCLPTNHGESIVMRILDKEGLKLGLAELGFFSDDQETFEKLISLPDGIFLVTGPTGSGKTTTLYSCLNYINKPDRKIITVEDPVEYQLDGINQVPVNEGIGLSFSTALRSMLRQSPNVIMLGEIRDLETAGIAINASLTGHLVFSTLHTNDAPSAVTRLVDIGVKPFLVASSTRGLMAQRLVRKVCKRCAAPTTPEESQLRAIGLDPHNTGDAKFMKGKGCSECTHTGYKGRIGIFEIFQIDDEMRRMIYDRTTSRQLRQRARETGMRTLREDGVRKVMAGMTTPEEVLRVTVADAD